VNFRVSPARTEALNPPPAEGAGMSDATKVVLGTVGVAALLVVVIIVSMAL
jgi:hypothetical protein